MGGWHPLAPRTPPPSSPTAGRTRPHTHLYSPELPQPLSPVGGGGLHSSLLRLCPLPGVAQEPPRRLRPIPGSWWGWKGLPCSSIGLRALVSTCSLSNRQQPSPQGANSPISLVCGCLCVCVHALVHVCPRLCVGVHVCPHCVCRCPCVSMPLSMLSTPLCVLDCVCNHVFAHTWNSSLRNQLGVALGLPSPPQDFLAKALGAWGVGMGRAPCWPACPSFPLCPPYPSPGPC